jgi:hypothetical protein
MAFVRACGFNLEATETSSAVDPRTIPPAPTPARGIELSPMSDLADDPEPIFVADRESALDEPGPADFSGMTYESWRRLIWDYPDLDRELSVVALADGVVVGATFLKCRSNNPDGRQTSARE